MNRLLPRKEEKPNDDDDEPEWTEQDTGMVMDIMEIALEKMKDNLVSKINSEANDEGLADEMELEQLEDKVKAAKSDTESVVQEIGTMVQVIVEVTSEEVGESITDNQMEDLQEGA